MSPRARTVALLLSSLLPCACAAPPEAQAPAPQQAAAAPAPATNQPAGADAKEPEVAWTDVVGWRIEGRAFADRAAPYDRLPAAAEQTVRKEVWNLSRDSAGMAIRFRSDSPSIHVRYTLTKAQLDMRHMPATGVSGADLYGRDAEGRWRWVAVSVPSKPEVKATLVKGLSQQPREWLLYLPLYNGVRTFELGVAPGASLEPVAPPAGLPVVAYGTSIMHGACASRPGMAWPAILGRRIDREVFNFGFSGNGRMEPGVAQHLVGIDAAAFVIDCLPNMTPQQVAERTIPLVRQLREKHPTTPILLVEDRTFATHGSRKNARSSTAAAAPRCARPGRSSRPQATRTCTTCVAQGCWATTTTRPPTAPTRTTSACTAWRWPWPRPCSRCWRSSQFDAAPTCTTTSRWRAREAPTW